MKTREEIITSMCYTWRHDYGLDKPQGDDFASKLSAGMTQAERESLWNRMAQIFDNDIAPHMKLAKPRKPRMTPEQRANRKLIKSELGYSRIGADTFKRGR